jgi:hypothetical protein
MRWIGVCYIISRKNTCNIPTHPGIASPATPLCCAKRGIFCGAENKETGFDFINLSENQAPLLAPQYTGPGDEKKERRKVLVVLKH